MGNLVTANFRLYAAKSETAVHQSGNKVTVAAGGVTDVPEWYMDTLDTSSSRIIPLCRSGTTAQRPTNNSARPPKLGEPYIDTTVGDVIFFVGGTTWVNFAGVSK
jgi:hypothetical protein